MIDIKISISLFQNMTLLTYLIDKSQKLTENLFDYLANKGYGDVYNSIYVVVICIHSDHL